MSTETLNQTQQRLKELAGKVVLMDKIKRRVILDEMTTLSQTLTTAQQLQLVNAVNEAPALRFLSAVGIRGDARKALFAKQSALEGI